jgi:hypothetical protein
MSRWCLLAVLAGCSGTIERVEIPWGDFEDACHEYGTEHHCQYPRAAAKLELADRVIRVATWRQRVQIDGVVRSAPRSEEQSHLQDRMFVVWLLSADGNVLDHVPLLDDHDRYLFDGDIDLTHDDGAREFWRSSARVERVVISDEGADTTLDHDHPSMRDPRLLQIALLNGQRAPRGPIVASAWLRR